MERKGKHIGKNININQLIDYSPVHGDQTSSFCQFPGFEESDSEFDEEQFANVDEDVINIRMMDLKNLKNSSSSVITQKEILENNYSRHSDESIHNLRRDNYIENEGNKFLSGNLTDK